MRIACLVGEYPRWSERFIEREARELAGRGHELLLWPCERPLAAGRWLDSRGAALPPLLRPSRPGAWRQALAGLAACGPLQARRLFAALRALGLQPWEPDLVLAHFAGLPAVLGAGLAAGLRAPLVAAVHARDIWVPWGPGIRALGRASRIMVCNQATLAELGRAWPGLAARAVLAHHGVELPAGEEAGPRQGKLILACGRFVPKKGFKILLEAMAALRAQGTPAELCLVGQGPEHLGLGQHIRALGLDRAKVRIMPPQAPDALARLMSEAAVLCAPSIVAPDQDRDGIPNLILEALAAGTPVVAAAAGGIPEVVRDGETGWLVPAGDPAALAVALAQALADPGEAGRRARLGRAAVARDFALDKAVDRIEALLGAAAAR